VKLLPAFACFLLVGAAYAADDRVIERPLIAQTLDAFNKEADAIRFEMKAGGRYEFIKNDERLKIDARLGTMEGILQRHADKNDLSGNDKIAMLNAQEEINSILKHNDTNRLVCESRPPMGSNLPVKTCRTFGEVERQRAEAVRTMGEKNQMVNKQRSN